MEENNHKKINDKSFTDAKHNLKIEGRKGVFASGVREIISLSEEKIVLLLKNNEQLEIAGKNLKMGEFSSESGNFSASGNINSAKYAGEKTSIIKRIFK